MTQELLPCPFCGGEQIAVAPRDADTWSVICKACGCEVWGDDEEQAIRHWQARIAATALPDARADGLAARDREQRWEAALLDLIGAVDELIAHSEGVYGLHLNGDPAPWAELVEGGRHEDWLVALEDARAVQQSLSSTGPLALRTSTPQPAEAGETDATRKPTPSAEQQIVGDGLAKELERLAKPAFAEAPTPWDIDTLKSEGEYGPGPDPGVGFEVSAIYDAKGRALFDALNSDATIVQEDYPDEDGYALAYDLVSDATAKLVVALVNNLPCILAALSTPTRCCEETREAAARVADGYDDTAPDNPYSEAARIIATAIRSMPLPGTPLNEKEG